MLHYDFLFDIVALVALGLLIFPVESLRYISDREGWMVTRGVSELTEVVG